MAAAALAAVTGADGLIRRVARRPSGLIKKRECVMRRGFLIVALLVLASAAHASSTLRVGNEVLTAGDSSARVTALLGRPSSRTHPSRARGGSRRGRAHRSRSRGVRVITNEDRGEKWMYRRDDHVTTVTIVDGKVSDIDDRRL